MKSALNLSSGGVLSYFPRLPSTLVTPPPSLPGFILGSLSLLSSTPSLSLRFLILLLRDSIILLLFPSSSSSSSSTPRRPPPAPHLHSSLTLSRMLSLSPFFSLSPMLAAAGDWSRSSPSALRRGSLTPLQPDEDTSEPGKKEIKEKRWIRRGEVSEWRQDK